MKYAAVSLTDCFCDYLTVSQPFPTGPDIGRWQFETNAARSKLYAAELRRLWAEGSHSTKVSVFKNPNIAWLSGNAGRFSRPDNVFGYRIDDCLQIVDTVTAELGVSPFRPGEKILTPRGAEYDGARFSRVDITQNVSFGSESDKQAFLQMLRRTNRTRKKKQVQANSISFGTGANKRLIVYDKAREIRDHTPKKAWTKYHSDLVAYLQDNHTLRLELCIGNTGLPRQGLAFYHQMHQAKLVQLLQREVEFMSAEEELIDYATMPTELLATLMRYEKGVDVKKIMARKTFYRHRKALLKYGIDIKETLNVKPLIHKPVTIVMRELPVPDWYQKPEPKEIGEAIAKSVKEQGLQKE